MWQTDRQTSGHLRRCTKPQTTIAKPMINATNTITNTDRPATRYTRTLRNPVSDLDLSPFAWAWGSFFFTFGRGAKYCDKYICLSVSLSVSTLAYPYLKNHTDEFHQYLCMLPSGCGSVLLWRRCHMLCTSGSMDDVIFARNRPYGSVLDCCEHRTDKPVLEMD